MFSWFRSVVVAGCSCALLAGCGDGSSAPSPSAAGEAAAAAASRQSSSGSTLPWGLSDAGRPAVFVSRQYPGAVEMYSASGKHVGSRAFHNGQVGINGGLATDPARNLYVGDKHNIDVFAPNYKGKARVIDGPGLGFSSLAVDQRTGLVAGGNRHGESNAVLLIYAKGGTEPCDKLTSDATDDINAVAFDAEGDIYVTSFGTDGKGHILRAAGGCAATGFTELTTSNVFGQLGGIQFNADDRPVLSDATESKLYTYDRPAGASLGSPIATTSVQDAYRSFAFRADGKALWMVGQSNVCEYAYPAGGAPIVCVGQTNGEVAVAPALVP